MPLPGVQLYGWNGTQPERIGISPISYQWSGSGTTNAPTATNLSDFVIGVNSSGASTGNVYHVIDGTWTDTGATVANLYGG